MPAHSIPHQFTYAILYASDEVVDRDYSPIVPIEVSREHDVTTPHGMKRDMTAALPALWYSLHLPRTEFDYREISGNNVVAGNNLDMPQQILLAPFPLARSPDMRRVFETRRCDLILCSESQLRQVTDFANEIGGVLEVCSFDSLGETSLQRHWRLLSKRARSVDDGFAEPIPLVFDIRSAITLTPLLFVARRLGRESLVVDDAARQSPLMCALMTHVELQAMGRVQEQLNLGQAEPKDIDGETFLREAKVALKIPVVLAAPGVPRNYRKQAFNSSAGFEPSQSSPDWRLGGVESPNGVAEELAISFMAAHRAAAQDGIAYSLPPIPHDLWVQLAALEDNYSAASSKPKKIQRMIKALGIGTAKLFDEDAVELMMRASRVTCYSGFPIGLALLPGATAPLACIQPVTYRPLLPLTRAVPQEGIDRGSRYWGRGFKLLVAECLDDDDRIRSLSEDAWRSLSDNMSQHNGMSCRLVFPKCAADLRNEISSDPPHALIISAHGFYRRENNCSGIVIGSDRVLGPELGWMPEVVFLSACHVGPRGVGVTSITDLLIRQGAWAVLSTQVPVDVRRNMTLMARLFSNVRSTIDGKLPARSLLDVWHHTATSNAVNDIIQSSPAIQEWSMAPTKDFKAVVLDFMLNRSKGRLRLAHIYEDTESILMEIAEETGFASKLRSILASQGYVPETALYHFVGWPERIIIRDEATARATEKHR